MRYLLYFIRNGTFLFPQHAGTEIDSKFFNRIYLLFTITITNSIVEIKLGQFEKR
mgnify:CR=1 FL=1